MPRMILPKLTNMAAAKQLPRCNQYLYRLDSSICCSRMDDTLDTYLDNAEIKDKFTAFTKGITRQSSKRYMVIFTPYPMV